MDFCSRMEAKVYFYFVTNTMLNTSPIPLCYGKNKHIQYTVKVINSLYEVFSANHLLSGKIDLVILHFQYPHMLRLGQ